MNYDPTVNISSSETYWAACNFHFNGYTSNVFNPFRFPKPEKTGIFENLNKILSYIFIINNVFYIFLDQIVTITEVLDKYNNAVFIKLSYSNHIVIDYLRK